MARRTWDREEAVAQREQKLELFAQNIERAVEQLVTGEDWLRAVQFAARFRSRSFQNTLAIWVQHQDAYGKGLALEPFPTYVAGFKDWAKQDRYPIAGRGYVILAPVHAVFASSNPASGIWRRLSRGEKPRTGETVRRELIGVKPAHVWDASQTTGEGEIPVKPMPVLLEGQAPAGLWDGLAAVVADEGFALRDVPDAAAIRGANGVTDFTERSVAVRLDMDDAARVKTLAHELGHVLMTDPRLRGNDVHRGIWEVEAESFAAMIGVCYGMDTTQYTVPYVAGWSEQVQDKTPVEVVRDTGKRVMDTALKTLERLPDPPLSDGMPAGGEQSERRAPQRRSAARAPGPEPVAL